VNFVTIYSDASVREGVCTYSFWARHSSGRIVKSGFCPKECKSVNQAETYAILQGMHKSLRKWKDVSGFYVFCDNRTVVDMLNLNVPPAIASNGTMNRLRHAYAKMVGAGKLKMVVSHIKAHTGKTEKTGVWLNSWCDKEARKLLREKFKNAAE